MDVRFQQRRAGIRHQERKRRLRRTQTLLAIAALVGVLWAIERSPLVALDTILVEGNQRVAEEEILEAADLDLGTSTLRLDLGGAQQRVTSLAPIKEATIERVDAVTVRIAVVERVAQVRLHTPTRKWLVDGDGVVFAAGEGPGAMPVILFDHEVALGQTPEESGLVDVMAVHAGLSGPLQARVTAYRTAPNGDVALLLEGDLVAVLGDAFELDEKIRAVGALLDEIEGTNVTRIDVRVPSRPTVSSP